MKLANLGPEWVDMPPRWGLGISWRCVAHSDCRVSVFFLNPVDGHTPVLQDKLDRPPLYFRIGSGLGSLTIADRINAWPCWRGYLVEGNLVTETH